MHCKVGFMYASMREGGSWSLDRGADGTGTTIVSALYHTPDAGKTLVVGSGWDHSGGRVSSSDEGLQAHLRWLRVQGATSERPR